MMKIDKCKNCKHYSDFFDSCNLYYRSVYLGEGDWDIQHVRISEINKSECEYKAKEKQ